MSERLSIANGKLRLDGALIPSWEPSNFWSYLRQDGVNILGIDPDGNARLRQVIGLADDGTLLWTMQDPQFAFPGSDAEPGIIGMGFSPRWKAVWLDHPLLREIFIDPRNGSLHSYFSFIKNHRRLLIAGIRYNSEFATLDYSVDSTAVKMGGSIIYSRTEQDDCEVLALPNELFLQILKSNGSKRETIEVKRFDRNGSETGAIKSVSFGGRPHANSDRLKSQIAWDIDRKQLVFYFEGNGEVLMNPTDFKWSGIRSETKVGF